jgi:predicted nucleic acid-binding protein
MRKQRIYLDTSVISHLYAPDTPEKMADTLRLWEQIQTGDYEVVLSEVVFIELENCSEAKRAVLESFLRKLRYERVDSNSDTVALAGKFIDFGVLNEKSFDDCRHVAAALLAGCDIIVSWNFKHLVNVKTIKGARVIATMEGLRDIAIYSPTMLLVGGYDNE